MKKKKKGRSLEDYAIMERMGKLMRGRREEKKRIEGRDWTLVSLGKRTGVSSQALGYIEKGKKWPGPALLVKISQELGLNMEDLLRRRTFRDSQIDGDPAKVSGE